MSSYKLEVTETLQRVVTIEANDEKEAYRLVSDMYRDCQIILDSDDYIGKEINIID